MADPNEESDWAQACGGDERAFAALFDRHDERVFRHVLALTEQAADADEVTATSIATSRTTRTGAGSSTSG